MTTLEMTETVKRHALTGTRCCVAPIIIAALFVVLIFI